MHSFIKKNISLIVAIFILLQPLLDLLTGICLHYLNLNFTIGIIIRILFLVFICLVTIFIFKKKKLIIPYFLIGLYSIFYLTGILIYNDGGLFQEIQGLVKVFYFPILFISLFSIREEIRISKATLFTTLLIYLICLFVPNVLGIGYQTYEIAKTGSLGFFNSANEISGIISILTPIMFLILTETKSNLKRIITIILYLSVILMIGTKTPLLSLGITFLISLIYIWKKDFKAKKYKNIIISVGIIVIGIIALLIMIPKTNFYKNIEIHLDYLEIDNITDIFKDDELIDHFIFSQRLTFLRNKSLIYDESSLYQKIFGIGYLNKGEATKLIEMDYFDIFYSHGLVGFIIFFTISSYFLCKLLEKNPKRNYELAMFRTSLLLIIFLSFFTGHIITAPSVSLLSIILILSIPKRKKKSLLFADKNLGIGGIESAQVNLLNALNYQKYNVTLILEEKKGELLSKVNENVTIKELKVSDNSIVIVRKLINLTRKLIFKIFNYDNYAFSCCYTTYSYSCNKIAKIASKNNAFYVHSDYSNVYDTKEEFREFFDSRKVSDYKKIIFVSNEARNSFLNYYPDLKPKTFVLNNLINTKEILIKSEEKITEIPPKNTMLFVFVGRLDDSSKKLRRALKIVKEVPNLHLWIIGDGPDRKLYEEYAKEQKITKKVDFFGRKENPYPYMKKADYIILTSDYEGFPVTYLEALVLEKQIITTIPTSDDLLDMKNYAHIISKDEGKMISDVKTIITKNKQKPKIDLNKLQKDRVEKLEKLINS